MCCSGLPKSPCAFMRFSTASFPKISLRMATPRRYSSTVSMQCSSKGGKFMIPAAMRLLLAAALVFVTEFASAQGYPTRTVKLVVPYGPGSSPDSVGRIVAQQMQDALGQPVIVANVAGALANVG